MHLYSGAPRLYLSISDTAQDFISKGRLVGTDEKCSTLFLSGKPEVPIRVDVPRHSEKLCFYSKPLLAGVKGHP